MESSKALVSMDNCSQNGIKLREPIIEIAYEWFKRGFVTEEFVAYVKDDKKVSFPWTMIDKITPRPSKKVADTLETLGVKNMQPVITLKKTYIAPFVNAECIKRISSIKAGRPETMKDQLKWILSNKNLFLANLYETGIGDKIEEIFKEEISGLGAVRATVRKYLT